MYLPHKRGIQKKVHSIAVGRAGRPDVLLPVLQEVLQEPAGRYAVDHLLHGVLQGDGLVVLVLLVNFSRSNN